MRTWPQQGLLAGLWRSLSGHSGVGRGETVAELGGGSGQVTRRVLRSGQPELAHPQGSPAGSRPLGPPGPSLVSRRRAGLRAGLGAQK